MFKVKRERSFNRIKGVFKVNKRRSHEDPVFNQWLPQAEYEQEKKQLSKLKQPFQKFLRSFSRRKSSPASFTSNDLEKAVRNGYHVDVELEARLNLDQDIHSSDDDSDFDIPYAPRRNSAIRNNNNVMDGIGQCVRLDDDEDEREDDMPKENNNLYANLNHNLSNQDLPKNSLTQELAKLSRCGWYWGPISRTEAEEKLSNMENGAFLVRDSFDDMYLLSLSFRSHGRTLNTRIEYRNGMFSFYSQPEPEAYTSVIELIERSMEKSQEGIFCYSRAKNPGSHSFPVRLTKPVSRFTQVRSLQYLCRFIIRQYIRVDHIAKLPLPLSIREYLLEAHY